jgi:diadenosine hexaphosphate hydrolase (ATP-forming)
MDERNEISAGGVVYRRVAGDVEVAIAEQRDRVTAALTTRLPKGKIESGETAEEAAVREVEEEVGLASRVVGDLGSVRYVYNEPSGRVSKEVHYFLMEWVHTEPRELDGEMERVYWCSIPKAERTLTFETEQRVMSRALTQLESGDRG